MIAIASALEFEKMQKGAKGEINGRGMRGAIRPEGPQESWRLTRFSPGQNVECLTFGLGVALV